MIGHPEFRPHGVGYATDNGQTEPGPARGGPLPGLEELLEQPGPGFRRDPRPCVANRQAQAHLAIRGRTDPGADQHAAPPAIGRGHLHRIAGEVEQDLLQPTVIGQDRRHVPVRGPGHVQTGRVGAGGQKLRHPHQQVLQTHGARLQVQSPGFELGQVQDVVHQGQQVLATQLQGIQIGALGVVQGGFRQQSGHAQDPVQGGPDLVAEGGQRPHPGQQAAIIGGGVRPGPAGGREIGGLRHRVSVIPCHRATLAPRP